MFQKLICRGSWSRRGSPACWKIQKSRCLINLKRNFKIAFFWIKIFQKLICRGSCSRPGSPACWKIQKSLCLIFLKCNS